MLNLSSITPEALKGMSRSQKEKLLLMVEEYERRLKGKRLFSMYPDKGPLRRELYPKHLEFFAAGKKYRERAAMGGNRIGKSFGIGGYEMVLHLTGLYPEWWEGRRFNDPITAWAAGDTTQTVRDINQEILLGPPSAYGTGLIPKDYIIKEMPRPGSIPDAIESTLVKHVSGGISRLVFKSYDQKRRSFQGTGIEVVWLDEEPQMAIYTECLMRTMTTKGMLLLTFTPLMGLSEVVMEFMPGGKLPENTAEYGKYLVSIAWEDVPHLTERDKKEILDSVPAYQRKARSRGIPQLGSGVIYPIDEEEVVVDPFKLPEHWPRVYGMDVGWRCTAAVWGAHDRENDILYLYSEHYRGYAEPSVHAEGIKARGWWIPGVIDPASSGSGQSDGKRLIDGYNDLGLNLVYADNSVEAGLLAVWQRISSGKLKVFRHLQNWLAEFRVYRRDEKGRIVKERDHLLDATRYLVMSGINMASLPPEEDDTDLYMAAQSASGNSGRDYMTGY